MFGIGSTELLVILLVALVVLGPKSLAGVSRTLGKAMGEFRRVSTDFQRTLNAEVAREEEEEKQRKSAAAASAPSAPSERETADAARRTETAGQSAEAATLDTTARPSAAPDAAVPPQGSPLEKAVAATRAAAQAGPAPSEAASSGSERA